MSLLNEQVDFIESLFSNHEASHLNNARARFIYYHNIRTTLRKTLVEIYPLLVKLLGEDFFNQIAELYINDYPSCSSNLNDYGEYMHCFLKHAPGTEDLLYLPEVAEFEWICHRLYFAPNHDNLNLSFLENINPTDFPYLYLSLHPASFLKIFNYPILDILALCEDKIEGNLDISDPQQTYLLIHRRGFDLSYSELSEAEFHFLDAINNNLSLIEALEGTLKLDAEFDLTSQLEQWIQDKTIVNIYLATKDVNATLPANLGQN